MGLILTHDYYLKILSYKPYSISNETDDIQNKIYQQVNINDKIDQIDQIQKKEHCDDETVSYKIPIKPDNNNNNAKDENILNNNLKIFNIVYNIFVILVISWKLFFIFGYALYNGDIMFVFRNLYDLGIPIQYYFGKKYFKKNHFKNIINKAKIFYPDKYLKYMKIYSIGLLIFSIIFSIIELVLVLVNKSKIGLSLYSTIFSYTTKYTTPYIIILFFVGNLYSINIFFTNVFAFSVVFRIISLDVQKFYDDIKNKKSNYLPSELCNNMIRLRNDYEGAQDELNFTFSTIVFFGGVATYVVMIDAKQGNSTPFQFMYAGIFLVLSLIYFKSILVTKEVRRSLHSYSYSNEMIEKLLSRSKIKSNYKSKEDNSELRSIILDSENAETLDWLITYQLFGDEWDNFRLFGFAFDDLELFKKGLIMLVTFYAVGKFSQVFELFN